MSFQDPDGILNEISSFDDSFQAQEGNLYREGIECLPDGNYDFTIIAAELKRSQNAGHPMLELHIRAGDGRECNHTYWLNRDMSINILGGDLAVLGFNTRACNGGQGAKFSQVLGQAIPQLPGLRFRGTKKTAQPKEPGGKVFHNLYVNAALKPEDGRSAPQTVQQQAAQPAPALPQVDVSNSGGSTGDEIPF